MAENLVVGTLQARLTADSAQFESGIRKGKQKLDELIVGMTAAGKAATDSARLINGMSQAGREVAEAAGRAARPLSALMLGMSAAGKQASASGRLIAGMGQAGRAEMERLATEAKRASESISLTDRAAGLLKGTFAQFTAANLAAGAIRGVTTAVTGLVGEAIAGAGHVLDLANATGLSTATIQRMEFVARQTGTELDTFTDAAFRLGVNLASGDGSVNAAVRALGLSLTDLQRMNPSQQFEAIVSGLGNVASQTVRNRLGVELFGRQFNDIAAAIGEGYDDIARHARIAGDAQLKAIDQATDRWQKFKDNLKTGITSAIGQGLLEQDAEREVLEEILKKRENVSLDELDRRVGSRILEKMLPEAPAIGVGGAAIVEDPTFKERRAFDLLEDRVSQAVQQAKRHAEEMKRLREQMAGYATDHWRDLNRIMAAGIGAPDLSTFESDRAAGPGAAPPSMRGAILGRFSARDLMHAAPLVSLERDNISGRMGGSGFADYLGANMQSAVMSAFQGGGSVGKSIGGLFGGGLASQVMGSGVGKAISSSLSSVLGSTIGGSLSAVIPGLGAIAGPLLGKAFGKIGGLFTGGEGAKTNDQRDAFVKQFTGQGDLRAGQEQLRKMAAEAGVTDAEIRKLFDTKKVKDFEAAAKAVTDKIQEQQAIVEKYGLTWANFQGPKRAEEFTKALKGVESDTEALERAGLSHHDALEKTAGAYVELARQGIAAGTGIEPALAPVLLELEQMGLLTDDMVASLQGVANDGLPTWQQMQEAAEKYGLKIDGMGERYQQLLVGDEASTILKDFKTLQEGGVPIANLLGEMSDEVNTFLHRAMGFGTEVPAAMRPMLELFAEQGLLTDESGQKLEDLSKVKFAQPLESAIQGLIDKMGELIDRIGGVGSAFAGLPKSIDMGAPSFDPSDFAIPMAAGGSGIVDSPTLFLAGEAGTEEFAFSGAGRRFTNPAGYDEHNLMLKRVHNALRDLPRAIFEASKNGYLMGPATRGGWA